MRAPVLVLSGILVGACLFTGSTFHLGRVQAQAVSTISNGLGRERLDFTATEGQSIFPTAAAFPRSNVVDVFKNGILQRMPQDYTQASIPGGTIQITFAQPLHGPQPGTPGDYVTLFYWR
jgi:hypothetical protein